MRYTIVKVFECCPASIYITLQRNLIRNRPSLAAKMKLTASIITATIALFATASVAESGGGFMKKCEDIRLEGVNYRKCDKDECRTLTYFKLWAECTALDDKPYKNELNLNLCLVNDHGNMQWRRRLECTQSPLRTFR